ncbi:MAG: VanZ family protein [Hespellia sp.]|nr:VanZ family protein [Hespellia sp.]
MRRIYSTLIEMIAAGIFIVPIFSMYGKFIFHSLRRTIMYIIFGLYLVAVLALVGFPNIAYICFDITINVIPFVGMAADFHNTWLNVLLFVPLGIFLPLLWDKYKDIKCTLMFSVIMTIGIEFSQIFTHRATDINDVIANVLGAFIGYCLIKTITNKFARYVKRESHVNELYIVFGTAVLVMFFMQPFVSSLLWKMILA